MFVNLRQKLAISRQVATRLSAQWDAAASRATAGERHCATVPRGALPVQEVSVAWRTRCTIGYWWAYRSPSPTSQDLDHYVRRLVSGLFVGIGVYVLFWPTIVLLLILAVSFGYKCVAEVVVVWPSLI